MSKKKILIAALIFIFVFIIYQASPIKEGTDTIWQIYVSMSFVKDHNLNLDEYRNLLDMDYKVQEINGHIYSYFPIGTPLIAAPLTYLENRFIPAKNGKSLSNYLSKNIPDSYTTDLAKLDASIIVALAIALFFLIATEELDLFRSVFITLIFALGTSAWSTASRGLWQHGPSLLMLTCCLYLAVLAKHKPWLISFAGIPLAFSYIIRPTNSISIVVFSIFIFLKYRKYFIPYAFGLTLILGSLVYYNLSIYGTILSPYYAASRLGGQSFLLDALAGNLISPGRGLLIWSPIFILIGSQIFRIIKNISSASLEFCALMIILAHWGAISLFNQWATGWFLGPRFFTDLTPYLIFLMIPIIKGFLPDRARLNLSSSFLILLTLISVFIQFRCSVYIEPSRWSGIPRNVDEYPERIWDIMDIQFLRGMCANPNDPAPKCWLPQEIGIHSTNPLMTFSNRDKSGN